MAVATSRDDEIRLIWTENQWLYLVAGFLGGILFCLLIQLSINNLPELVINLLPEAAGIFITVTVIDVLNRRRDKQNSIRELQEQLVRDASSIVNDVANNAVHQLRKFDWLIGDKGLLAGKDLHGANLKNAFLSETNLKGANLVIAELQKADLILVELQKANLESAQLQDADLSGANLQGSILLNANLRNTHFGKGEYEAIFDRTTRLPDGTFWTPETDMTKFTKPKANSQ